MVLIALLDHKTSKEVKESACSSDPFIVSGRLNEVASPGVSSSDDGKSFSSREDGSVRSQKTLTSPSDEAVSNGVKHIGNAISGENAQSFFTPESCIFVAKYVVYLT